MKYYCIQYEDCGFFHYDLEMQPEDYLTCPSCGHMLLAYELNATPSFLVSHHQFVNDLIEAQELLDGSSRSPIIGVEDDELYTD